MSRTSWLSLGPAGSAFGQLAQPSASWLSLRPAGSPKAAFSARACLRLPQAPASLDKLGAWAALAGHVGLVITIGAARRHRARLRDGRARSTPPLPRLRCPRRAATPATAAPLPAHAPCHHAPHGHGEGTVRCREWSPYATRPRATCRSDSGTCACVFVVRVHVRHLQASRAH